MIGRRMEKLTERFVGPYRVKRIILANEIELELPSSIKIHPVVNVSRVCMCRNQVEGQRREIPQPVVIEGEEEWKVEKILNKRIVMEFLELLGLSPSDQQWLDYLWSSGVGEIDVTPSDSLIHSSQLTHS